MQSRFGQAPSENGFDAELIFGFKLQPVSQAKEWDSRHYALVLLYPQPLKVFSSLFVPSQ